MPTTLPRAALAALALGAGALGLAACSNGSSASASLSTSAPVATTNDPTAPVTTATTSAGLGNVTTSAACPTPFTAGSALTKPSWTKAPAMTVNTARTYTAVVTTDVGSFTITLDPKAAPQTVNSFVFLAENHFYDCVVFHRVIPTFMNQTGDPTGAGTGGPGYTIADENPPAAATGAAQYPIGAVAMANTSQPHSGGSQFFIVTGSEGEGLPPSYALFGTVTAGLPVVQQINSDGSAGGTPTVLHRMISVVVTES